MAVEPLLVLGGDVGAHEVGREGEEVVDEEDSERRVDEDLGGVERARVDARCRGDEVGDEDVARVEEELADDLLCDVGEPGLPLAARVLAHALYDEAREDDGAHDGLGDEADGAEEAAGVEVDLVADFLEERGADGRVGDGAEGEADGLGGRVEG